MAGLLQGGMSLLASLRVLLLLAVLHLLLLSPSLLPATESCPLPHSLLRCSLLAGVCHAVLLSCLQALPVTPTLVFVSSSLILLNALVQPKSVLNPPPNSHPTGAPCCCWCLHSAACFAALQLAACALAWASAAASCCCSWCRLAPHSNTDSCRCMVAGVALRLRLCWAAKVLLLHPCSFTIMLN